MVRINTESYRAFLRCDNPRFAEQDWLECHLLSELFQDAYFAKNIVFTGGSTLTKSYHLSTRYNHDLDLTCTDFEDIPDNRSGKALNNFRNRFKEYVFDVIRPKINYVANQNKKFMILTDRDWRVLNDSTNIPSTPSLHFLYKSIHRPDVGYMCLEFIPRSYPASSITLCPITPYATHKTLGPIPTLCYSQTFWDKIFALHTMSLTTEDRVPLTCSRHYYDVANIADKVDLDTTQAMFNCTQQYQMKYTHKKISPIVSMADINLIPNMTVGKKLVTDYQNVLKMYAPHLPSWKDIMHKLMILNKRIQQL